MKGLQYAYLKAMGIDVWQSRKPAHAVPVSAVPGIPEAAVTNTTDGGPVSAISSEINDMGWDTLAEQVVSCQLCELSQSRKQTVFGVGDKKASLMLIGEAPGAEEDKKGEPFVGEAGQLLTAMLKAMGYQRHEVYIANILKCRPPQNRDPSPEEVNKCWPYLQRQIELIQPTIILALGRIAAQQLLQTKTSLGRLRGQLHYIEGIQVPVVVTYHPAYLLRAPSEKRKAWQDLQFVMGRLEQSK